MSPSLKRWITQNIAGKPIKSRARPVKAKEPPLTQNYPFQYVREMEVRGKRVCVRPIRPDDGELMLELFGTFSEDTIYDRFFAHVTMSPAKIKRFTMIDYIKQMALVAVEGDGDKRRILGVARYATCEEGKHRAEMAIVVGDPWQKSGIGSVLLERLMAVAKNEGYEELYGLVHYENTGIEKLFERLKTPFKLRDTGTESKYTVQLKEPA